MTKKEFSGNLSKIFQRKMLIKYRKKFQKQYEKLDKKLQNKVDATIEKFIKNPFDPQLNNHQLKGLSKTKEIRSLNVTGDYRIHFKEYEGYTTVLMIAIGTHSQLY